MLISLCTYTYVHVYIHTMCGMLWKKKYFWKQPETSHTVFSSLVTCRVRNLFLEVLILQRMMHMLYRGLSLHSLWLQCVICMVKQICKLLTGYRLLVLYFVNYYNMSLFAGGLAFKFIDPNYLCLYMFALYFYLHLKMALLH